MIKLNKDITYLGAVDIRGERRLFGIKNQDRQYHMYILGKSGVGKTTLLMNIAVQDIWNGRGLCIIDPHGEFAEQMTRSIPPERINDVIYFNPADTEYPIGLDVLDLPDPRYKHIVVSDVLSIFKHLWKGDWNSQLESIIRNCLLALVDVPKSSILDIVRLLTDNDFREMVLKSAQDEVVRVFWQHEYEKWREQFYDSVVPVIQNKLGPFIHTPLVRNIVGQMHSTVDIDKVMDEGKIFIANLSKGKVGEDNAALLGSLIIAKIQLAVMRRSNRPLSELRPFYLYIDEFQNYNIDPFSTLLSESRKYQLRLIIAHQYAAQLNNNPEIKDAILGNVGNMICFRLGADDAGMLASEFSPEFSAQDLIELPNYEICLKLMIDGKASRPFSAQTLPYFDFKTDGDMKEKVIEASRKNYALPRATVEKMIREWSGGGAITEEKLGVSGIDTGVGAGNKEGEDGGNNYEDLEKLGIGVG